MGVVIVADCKGMDKGALREELFNRLTNNDFHGAKKILRHNPDFIDNSYNDDYAALLNDTFQLKFINTSPASYAYYHLKDLVHCGFDLDIRDYSGVPLLCKVIDYGHADKYLDLLRGGAWVNIQDNHGRSPIVYAAEMGDNEKIKNLLLYGAAVNTNMYKYMSCNHPKRLLLMQLDVNQTCHLCKSHAYDLTNIPCINRHLGNFICMHCYSLLCYHASPQCPKCPICLRTLGKFGF